jgi:hypothetical protein
LFPDVFIVLFLSAIFTFIFLIGIKRERKIRPVLKFFLIFFYSLGRGVWLTPMGHEAEAVAWVNFLIVASIVSLILFVMMPKIQVGRSGSTPEEEQVEGQKEENVSSVTFWILLFVLGFSIVNY